MISTLLELAGLVAGVEGFAAWGHQPMPGRLAAGVALFFVGYCADGWSIDRAKLTAPARSVVAALKTLRARAGKK